MARTRPPTSPTDERRRNQIKAFRQVYGRDPTSANDWRMADALDPHTYDPWYRGTESNVVVGRFKPVPGAGVYRQNIYIPSAEVQNVEPNKRLVPHMAGDNRGPSSTVPAESSRVSIYADMDHGILVARQNPTMSTDGVDAGAGVPTVEALQGPDGSLEISYTAKDPFEPDLAKPFVDVSGRVVVNPTTDGKITAGGSVTQYPNIEAYQYKPDGTTTQLFHREVTTSQTGPMFDLPRENVWIGNVAHGLYPPPGGAYLPPAPTDLGPAAHPPVIQMVQPPTPPSAPTPPVAAPPLPVPEPPPLPPR